MLALKENGIKLWDVFFGEEVVNYLGHRIDWASLCEKKMDDIMRRHEPKNIQELHSWAISPITRASHQYVQHTFPTTQPSKKGFEMEVGQRRKE